MAPKPAVVEEQPINAIPYYPAQQQQQQQFQANYNPNSAWYQQAPSPLQPNLVPNIQEANNISHNGQDPIRRLKIRLTNLSGAVCCCFMLFIFFAAIVGGFYFENANPVIETSVHCYFESGSGNLNSLTYTPTVNTDESTDAGLYAQSTISGSLSSTDVISCSLTTSYDSISSGYFIFYFSYETNDLCLDLDSVPSTRCSTTEAIQYTESCSEIDYDPTSCENKYLIMNYDNYESTYIYITTAQGVSESNVAFTLDYTLVFNIKEEGAPFFYISLMLMVLALIFFCGACWQCVALKKKYKIALMSANQF